MNVPDGRTLKEMVVDRLLLLHILSNFRVGRTKLQKTVFFTEDKLNNEGVKAFNYFFFRWHYGEFSRELETDYFHLQRNDSLRQNTTNLLPFLLY